MHAERLNGRSATRGNVLLVRPARGGVAAHAAGTARGLVDAGWEVVELALPAGGIPALVARSALASQKGSLAGADIVHVELGCLDLSAFWFALLAARSKTVAVVAHDAPRLVLAPATGLIGGGDRVRDVIGHRLLSPSLDGLVAAAFARRVAVGVVLSEAARADWGQGAPRQVVVAEHGADPPTAGAPPPSQGGYVLFAGYVGQSKGLDVLIEAWAGIGAESGLPLVIAGTNTGGDEERRYERGLQASAARLTSAPMWLGYVPDERYVQLVAEAAVVVAPYRRSNPASGVIVRALVEGRAVVATRVPAATDGIDDGVNGLLVDSGDASGLRDALRRLVDDPALRDRLGAAAAQRAADRYTWPRFVEGLEGAYRLAGVGR